MTKTISVLLFMKDQDKLKNDKNYFEEEFDEVNKALKDGFTINQVITTKVDGLYWINHLFILVK